MDLTQAFAPELGRQKMRHAKLSGLIFFIRTFVVYVYDDFFYGWRVAYFFTTLN